MSDLDLSDLDHSVTWARQNMPLTEAQIAALPDLRGARLACSVHLELKALPFFEELMRRGAALFLTTCNPHTVRDEVVERLVARGAEAHAWKGMSAADQEEALDRALSWSPTHLYEMGALIASRVMEKGAAAAVPAVSAVQSVSAGLEATGSGISLITRLLDEGRALPFPVYNCDDVPIKEGLHNRHLVGLSTWQAFMERTWLSLHGKNVLVVGYGLVGQGVAETARAFGGVVSVAERDPARALAARYAGFQAGTLESLAPEAHVIVTATGRPGVLTAAQFPLLKEDCFLLNVGHTADEIEVSALGPRSAVIPFVEQACPAGRRVFLFAGGSMANLTAGKGDTLNSFDVTMATLAAGLRYIFSAEAARRPPGLHTLPRSAWEEVARSASG
ncbi:MAG TPA: adenosylhomocysteinase [Spirochaetia bacterium]|nr:adenosylhomocysteinase [Spirochaetia bacterium]